MSKHYPRQSLASLYIGLMSGTSLDGVDAVLCSFADTFAIYAHVQEPMPAALKEALLRLQTPSDNEIDLAAHAANALARLYAETVQQLLASSAARQAMDKAAGKAAIQAIGCHGQTIRHQPDASAFAQASPYSIQINNPSLLAELSGINVIADFRSRDLAAGGQGAPLVPAFHASLFSHAQQHRVILNLGGMANLTNLPPACKPLAGVNGFDCAPGMVLLDAWIQRHRAQAYDKHGEWAAGGNCDQALLTSLLAHPFLQRPPPKSCGREQFSLHWLEQAPLSAQIARLSAQDVQATLLEFTARSIAEAVERYCSGAQALYACGGGANNNSLMHRLAELLPAVHVDTTAALALPVETVEAAAFAWLAWRFMQGATGNLPQVTGARGERLLGALYPA